MSARIGIVGTGWGARVQVPAWRRAGLEVTALAGRRPAVVEEKAGELGIPHACSSPEELLAHPEVDLVSLVTPPHTHHRWALEALARGKHVLCEKPMALDAFEAAEMVAAARAAPDRLCLVDHELRFLPSRLHLRRLLAQGFTGPVLHVDTAFWGGGRLGDRWGWDWWSRREHGGGVLGALGSHLLDAVLWLVGQPVEAVRATLRTVKAQRPDRSGVLRPVTSDDLAVLELRLAGAGVAMVQVSAMAAGGRGHHLRIMGERGSLLWQDGVLYGARAGDRQAEMLARDEEAADEGGRDDEWTRGTLALGRALRSALEGGDRRPLEPAATFADGLAVQRILDAAHRAHRQGTWVEVGG